MKKSITKVTKEKVKTKSTLEREKIARESEKFVIELSKIKKDPNFDLLKWMRKNAIVTGKKVDVLKILKKVRG